MKYILSVILALLIFINYGNIQTSKAQTGTTTSDPITTLPTKADDITDSQLRDLLQKAQATGMTDDQIRQAAIGKGMPETEVNKLQIRINAIRGIKETNTDNITIKPTSTGENAKSVTTVLPKTTDGLSIFGAEYFNNSNLTFEPNLRLPTPKNYILGPDDQVVIDIFGNSVAHWALTVSADGNISIPNIGLLNVSGKSIESVIGIVTSKLIANHYSIGHGTNVAVTVGNIRSIKVSLVGEIAKPGTYTLSALATVFNALYLSGGPNAIGSFRKISVIRNNSIIRTLDFYDFLLKSSQKDNIRLEDGDVISVPTYKVHVTMTGQIKRPAIYEVLPGESLRDVINFAGGFTDQAYTSSIKAIQVTDKDHKVTDISLADFSSYVPLRGDQYIIDPILNRYENRVSIYGAVYRPGQFELDSGLTLTRLITKAAGLSPNAFTSHGYISRLKTDNTLEIISFDLKSIMNKTSSDIALKREDVVTIPSIFDLRNAYTVTISGDIRSGGDFAYADKMSVEDLIIQAGGFTESASPKHISVARRVTDGDPNQKNSPVSNVFTIDVDDQFKFNASSFLLQPFDVVSVYSLPGYEKQRMVKIEGEVLYPGPYAITTKDEKISDLIKRAGGLNASADVDGGRLKRTDKLGVDNEKGKTDINELTQERADRLSHIQKTLKDSTTNTFDQLKNGYVGIDLREILKTPGSDIDLILEEGDVLRIPKQQQLVMVNGEVLFPSSVVFSSNKTLAGFVNNAGGFSPDALRRKAYVVYANGSVKSTHNFLFFRSYPTIKPGSEIIIPKRPVTKGLSATEVGSIAAALASAAAALIGVLSLAKL